MQSESKYFKHLRKCCIDSKARALTNSLSKCRLVYCSFSNLSFLISYFDWFGKSCIQFACFSSNSFKLFYVFSWCWLCTQSPQKALFLKCTHFSEGQTNWNRICIITYLAYHYRLFPLKSILKSIVHIRNGRKRVC